MEGLLSYLKQRCQEDWLLGYDSRQFYKMTEEYYLDFQAQSKAFKSPKIILNEAESGKFLATFLGAVAANCSVILGNHQWQQQEWEQVYQLVASSGNCSEKIFLISSPYLIPSPAILIPTGGSSGKIRFAIHTWETLGNSVRGFCQHFGVNQVNSFCVLPLYHVGGLMQFLRSFLTGGKILIIPYKRLKNGEKGKVNPENFFISLVPTQLQFILEFAPDWLSKFQTVMLGGATASPSLLERARQQQIPLALTYGMTETASQIAALKPHDFLKGYNNSGRSLPHTTIKIVGDYGNFLESNQVGTIAIQSNSLYRGYYPEFSPEIRVFQTDDIGFLDPAGYLHVVGRSSQKIITGGENVFPKEVEAAIIATQLVTDVAVIGIPDDKWGEAIAAVYVPKRPIISKTLIQRAIEDKISRFKQPKHWIKLNYLPRNELGKLNYHQLQETVMKEVKKLIPID
jgi:O-succinylbenzoic acid--CoA ligase